jgi:large subunit ribosomal protein L29
MKIEDLKGKTPDELKAMIGERKKELLNLRFRKASGELENTSRFKQVRKEIARIMTQINQQAKAA